MKRIIRILCFFLMPAMMITSCQKDKTAATKQSPVKNEVFYSKAWHQTARGWEIDVRSKNITAAVITEGFYVNVSFDSDMSPWVQIPATIRGIDISYMAETGHLFIIAKTSADLSREGLDIHMAYK